MAIQSEYRRTILIGLGGAGQTILLHVKKHFLDTFGKVPPCIRFLSLDTDAAAGKVMSINSGKEYSFEAGEREHLTIDDPCTYVSKDPLVQKWYTGDGPKGAICNGAGAIRQNGRLAFFHNFHRIQKRLDELLTAVNSMDLVDRMREEGFSLSNKAPEVYLCGSIAGGTGSGTFMDIGILFRNLLPNALIHGYFLLWWPYRNKAWAHRTAQNTYSALTELDFIQSIGEKGSTYEVVYPDKTVQVSQPPFSLVNLIDGRNEIGENVDDIGMICERVAQVIILTCSAMGYPIQSVVDNLLAHINVASPRLWGGKYARYSSLGVSSVYYPAPELHKILSAENAIRFWEETAARLRGERNEQNQEQAAKALLPEVQRLLESHKIDSWTKVLNDYFPPSGFISVSLTASQIKNNDKLQPMARDEEQNLTTNLETEKSSQWECFQGGCLQPWTDTVAGSLTDPFLSAIHKQLMKNVLMEGMETQLRALREEQKEAQEAYEESNQSQAEQLNQIRNLRGGLFGGNERKSKVEHWRQALERMLRNKARLFCLKSVEEAYQALQKAIDKVTVPAGVGAESAQILAEAGACLRQRLAEGQRAMDLLKRRSNICLIGDGKQVVFPQDKENRQAETAGRKSDLDYAEFLKESGMQTAEQCLLQCNGRPEALARQFYDYCCKKLEVLRETDVFQAAETLQKVSWAYGLDAAMDNLFRCSAAMWAYERAELNAFQSLQYDRVINIGVPDQEKGAQLLEGIIKGMKVKHGIKADHTFSTTEDPYQIRMMEYSAPLPAHMIKGLKEVKRLYESAMSPTFHIDSQLELKMADLFPVDEDSNIALRILGMAIVSGIDVVQDVHLRLQGGRGHEFLCNQPQITELNFGEPKKWTLFGDMYDEVTQDDDLRKRLVGLLREKVLSMDPQNLRSVIQAHIDHLLKKLNHRDFSKLYNARLTYREVEELKRFLSPSGYRMDINDYIAGR